MANIRATYAEVVTADLTGQGTKSKEVDITSDTSDWVSSDDAKIGDVTYKTLLGKDHTTIITDKKLTVSCENGVVTIGGVTVQGSSTTEED